MRFQAERISLPAGPELTGGWGSSLVPHPDRPIVYLSLPRGQSPVPWIAIDIARNRVTAAAGGLKGDLRAGVLGGDEGLFLGTHGLSRVRLTPDNPGVLESFKPAGLGTYLWRLFEFGDDHVLASRWGSDTSVVIRRASVEVVKRLAIPAPSATARLDSGTIRVFSFHSGVAMDFDPASLRKLAKTALPPGTSPLICGPEIFVLTGSREPADKHIPIERLWRIRPAKVTVLSAASLQEVRSAPVPEGCRDVLGLQDGHLVVSTERGLLLLDAQRLDVVGALQLSDRDAWQHAYVPAARAAALLDRRFTPAELTVVRWN